MTTNEVLTIIAIVIGPIGAVQVQKFIEKSSNAKNRKIWIFKTLMATRGSILSMDHVSALNRIDLEFSNNNKYRKVIEAWKLYFNNLCIKTGNEQQTIVWASKNDDLLADLLFEMGHSLSYDLDRSLIKRNVYSPIAHGKIERENTLIREKLISVFEGESSIPINLTEGRLIPEVTENQQKLQELLIEYYTQEIKKNVS